LHRRGDFSRKKFATDARLAKLLKLLVILVCLGVIVQRLMVLTY
jgi:hypothetical protein